jgi:hypothetical protein
MAFGIKKSTKHRLIGVKKELHRVSHFGVKALPVIEMLNPEFIPELEGTRQVLRKVDKLTK